MVVLVFYLPHTFRTDAVLTITDGQQIDKVIFFNIINKIDKVIV